MQIVLAWVATVMDVDRNRPPPRIDMGERHQLVEVRKASTCMWCNVAEPGDLEKARAHAADEQEKHPARGYQDDRVYSVHTFEPDVEDPRGRAAADALAVDKGDAVAFYPGVMIKRMGTIERGSKLVDGWALFNNGNENQPWMTKGEATRAARIIAAMRDPKPRHNDRESTGGRYAKTPPCDACGKPVGTEYATDEEVCGSTDGPGFRLCSRKRCRAKLVGMSVEDRRALYCRVREEFCPRDYQER